MVHRAPPRHETPLPSSFGLSVDDTTTMLGGGRVLMGGSPLRLWRLSPRAQRVVARWRAGDPVGDGRTHGLLARRLASAGAMVPHPHSSPQSSSIGPQIVTVVIPVRDRPEQLARLLGTLDGLTVIVVDDASRDAERSRLVAERHGARWVALERNGGPSAARNAGWSEATTPIVAFVDSDCVPLAGWLEPLLAYFDDPLVAAVAPRVTPAPITPPTTVSRYQATHSSLDRGRRAGLVRPQSPIPYVPSAALLVRRAVAGAQLFDPGLRVGEDVDLVWRLDAAGWDVRYVPGSRVAHDGPATGMELLRRRAFYGTSAATLAQRHPADMAPLQTSIWSAAVWVLALARRPWLALGVLAASIGVLARRLDGVVDEPVMVAARIAGGGTAQSALPALGGLVRAWSPALAVGLLSRRTRGLAAAALLAPAIRDWIGGPRDLDLPRHVALHVADDMAYGSGVWAGCVRQRTIVPLVPRIALRSRIWSSGSLRAQVRDDDEGPAST
jgi:mycofactocin system glycosyltransferase